MSKLFIKIHNVETDEVIEREMTKDEIIQAEKDSLEIIKINEAKEAKEAERRSLLERLGLTEDEAKLLLS